MPNLLIYCWDAIINWIIRKNIYFLSVFGILNSIPIANISWIAQKRNINRANGQPEIFFIGIIKLIIMVNYINKRYEILWEK